MMPSQPLSENSVTEPRHIILTWPKTRSLESYFNELARAEREGMVINYRVSRFPAWTDAEVFWDHGALCFHGHEPVRCYMVHDGAIPGWCSIDYCCRREEGEVEGWPAGLYLVRDPRWHPIEPFPMAGFRGYRWAPDELLERSNGS